MGFEAKMLFFLKTTNKADQKGQKGETDCTVWQYSSPEINFERVTRLEKVVGQRFAHLFHLPFERAGICVVDCFFTRLFTGLADNVEQRFAPEILVKKVSWDMGDERTSTITVGGLTYLHCPESRFKGRMGDPREQIADHNELVKKGHKALLSYLDTEEWSIYSPPFLSASCVELASWLTKSEEEKTEGWKALEKDRSSLAIVLGWRHMLRELGEVGAKAVFVFS